MQYEPIDFWNQIAEVKQQAPRKSTSGKRDLTQITARLIDLVSSWVNEPEAVKLHYEHAKDNYIKFGDLQSVCVLLRDNFSFSKRLFPNFVPSTRGLDTLQLHEQFCSLLEARIKDLLPTKGWLTGFSQGSTEDHVISRTNSTQSLNFQSESDTANTSSSSETSQPRMADSNIEKVNLTGVKFRTPKDLDEETSFKRFNAQFVLWLKAYHIKIKEDISDSSKKEDPAIVMAYRATISQHRAWQSAVSRAAASHEGADLKTIMSAASKILQPAEKSMFQLCTAMSQAKQTDHSHDGCLRHYEKIRELKENPVLSDFKEPWFAFLLVHGSVHYDSLAAGAVDIETDSLEKIQECIEKIQLRSDIKNDATIAANFSKSRGKQFINSSSKSGGKRFNKNFSKNRYHSNKNKFFCKIHGECDHTTNKCTELESILRSRQRNSSSGNKFSKSEGRRKINQVANDEFPESSSDNFSDYGEEDLPHCAAVRTDISNVTAAPRVFTNILCKNPDGTKSINTKAQVDTAADMTVAPYHVAQNLGISYLDPLVSDIFSFDNKKATDQFAGRADINFEILGETHKINVLFLKPQNGQRRMLLGLDLLSKTSFDLSCNGTKWNFKFESDPQQDGRNYVQMVKSQGEQNSWVFEPGRAKVVECKLSTENRLKIASARQENPNQEFYTKPMHANELYMLPSIIDPENPAIAVVNTSDQPISISSDRFFVNGLEVENIDRRENKKNLKPDHVKEFVKLIAKKLSHLTDVRVRNQLARVHLEHPECFYENLTILGTIDCPPIKPIDPNEIKNLEPQKRRIFPEAVYRKAESAWQEMRKSQLVEKSSPELQAELSTIKIQERIEQIQLRSMIKNDATVAANYSNKRGKHFNRNISKIYPRAENKNSYFCKIHGKCNHSTDQCNELDAYIRSKDHELENKKAYFCKIHGKCNHSTDQCNELDAYIRSRHKNQLSKIYDAHSKHTDSNAQQVVATPRVFTNVTCENIQGSKSIEIRSQIDTAADITIAPYHVIQSLGIDNMTPVTKDVYSFHNGKATDKFAGQASVNFRILGKSYNTNVLFLKPHVGRPTMLWLLCLYLRTPSLGKRLSVTKFACSIW